MPTAYKWHPITDLGEDPASLTDGELEPLKRVWDGQKPELIESGALNEFDKQLRREWAIETGIIENVYTLDRGVTRELIRQGIDAALIPHGTTNRDPALVARIIQDHYEALDGMFDFVGGQRELSTGYVKELHAALLRNQETYTVVDQFGHAFAKPLDRGAYKTEPNSPTRPDGTVHEYCPPEHVAAEMDRLIELHHAHQSQSTPPEVEAAWLHHRFTQIHPFADGNGRVARAIATLVLIRAGSFPLIVKREHWTRYITALEKADSDELRSLVSMVVEAQRHALIQTMQLANDRPLAAAPADRAGDVDQAIAAAKDVLVQRGILKPKEWRVAEDIADRLVEFAVLRVRAVSSKLSSEIRSGQFSFGANRVQAFPYDQVTRCALEKAGHQPTPQEFAAGINLHLNAGEVAHLGILFHSLGRRFRGLIGIVAYLMIQGGEPIVLEGGTFQINYEEDPAHTEARFSRWLEYIIAEGLNEWRKTL